MPPELDIERMLAERPSDAPSKAGLLRTGEMVGPWKVVAFLGRGRSSEVYRVVNSRIGGDGALKILADGGMGLRERFLFERELVAALSVPALPRFFGSGETKMRPYYVMEHLQPLQLPMARGKAVRFVVALARSVAELHAAGFIHRDLKPANVLMRRNGDPVIIDLGLVKKAPGCRSGRQPFEAFSIIDGRRVGVGTPGFAAPEQLINGEATVASDVYALGKMLKACCGAEADRRVREVVRRATAGDPSDRYASAEDFADALERAAKDGFFTPGIRMAAVMSASAAVAVCIAAIAFRRGGCGSALPPPAPQAGAVVPETAGAQAAESLTQRPGESDEDHFSRILLAAVAGNVQAAADVAEAYFNGHGVEVNREEAVEWYRVASDGGHVGSEATLGLCRLRGLGCERDDSEAASLFLDAAKKGHLGSMVNLAFCFMHGRGVDADPEAAFRWAMMAAERGHAGAQTFVGECYLDGKGVAQDRRRGDDWLTRAARQGNERARMLLRTR